MISTCFCSFHSLKESRNSRNSMKFSMKLLGCCEYSSTILMTLGDRILTKLVTS